MNGNRNGSLEAALAGTEEDAEATLKAAAGVVTSLKRLRSATQVGNLKELRRCLDTAEQALTALRQQFANAKEGWSFDEEAYFSDSTFADELVQTAEQRGLIMYKRDELLYCYPSLIRILAPDRAVAIDRVRDQRIRPTVLVARLKEIQGRRPKFRADAFLESLVEVYDRIVAYRKMRVGAVVRLREVYDWMTPLPGHSREYTLQEFARDIYLLDRSGEARTHAGRTVTLPAATATRNPGSTLVIITQGGQEKRYYGICFSERGG